MNGPTRVLKVDPAQPDPDVIEAAAEVIRAGGLVAFPTETVYGLGADATCPEAVARIFEAKGRPATNPLIVHAADIDQVRLALADWPSVAESLARHFWPGPLTLVLPRSPRIPDLVTAGQETVGVRIPDSVVALRLLMQSGRLIAAPSANRSTGVSPTEAGHVLKDLDGRIEMILDGGRTMVGIESTVLDLTGAIPRILRPGAITASQIGRVLGMEVEGFAKIVAQEGNYTSPGQMEMHYSPRTRLDLIQPSSLGNPPAEGRKIGLIVAGHEVCQVPGAYANRIDWDDPDQAARELYATLHQWDETGLDRIDVILPPDTEPWRAVHDRLWRASRRWAGMPLR